MSHTIVISREAWVDFEESFAWYLIRSPDAASGFSKAIEEGYLQIRNNPYGWRNEHSNYRELALKTYPYTIVYRILEEFEEVLITSIYHHKRDPLRKYSKD